MLSIPKARRGRPPLKDAKFLTPEYRAWQGMLNRCRSTKARLYYRYGGRGIKVCAKWEKNFAAFLADVGKRPTPNHSLDRIDNNGNYEPGNVRWATMREQMRNTSRCKLNEEAAKVFRSIGKQLVLATRIYGIRPETAILAAFGKTWG